MVANYTAWGERKKEEVTASGIPASDIEVEHRKLDERIGKFSDKFAFVAELKRIAAMSSPHKSVRRSSGVSQHSQQSRDSKS
jgi:hypothetical protein